jgi:cytoskeletal protein RodZ
MTKKRTMALTERRRGGFVGLCAFLVVLVALVLFGGHTDLAATTGLFQSPATATVEPTSTTPATETPTPTPTAEPPAATEELATQEPTSTAIDATPTVATKEPPTPSESPMPEAAPTEAAPAEVGPEATQDDSELYGQGESEQPQRYADGESNLRFDWGTLFDSLALGLSYAWLCCGVVLLLGLPILFVALWTRGKRDQVPEEDE